VGFQRAKATFLLCPIPIFSQAEQFAPAFEPFRTIIPQTNPAITSTVAATQMMAGPEIADPSRVAVRFKAASTQVKKATGQPPKSSLGKRHRAHHALDAESDSDERSSNHQVEHQRITAFGDDGAETEDIIRNRFHSAPRGASKIGSRGGGRGSPPDGDTVHRTGGDPVLEVEPAEREQPIKWGLTVARGATPADGRKEHAPAARRDGPATAENILAQDLEDGATRNERSGTADDGATGVPLGRPKRRLIGERRLRPLSEADAFRRDSGGAAEESTTEDYDAVSEDFGAAMLRGMGWDGKLTEKVKAVERRPAHMGLGAKKLDGEEELGAWNQKGGSKSSTKSRPRLDDYRSEERKGKERREEKYRDSYKQERDREKHLERNGYTRHRERHYQR